MSDTASIYSFSSSAPLVSSTPSKPKSLFRKVFTTSRPAKSPSSSPPSPTQDPEAIFREIMALNSRHGAPEVQSYTVKSRIPQSAERSTVKAKKSTKPSTEEARTAAEARFFAMSMRA
ncbi:hypothetical protein JCM10207_008970 [Rhodosporidiobolus poonsookiae]